MPRRRSSWSDFAPYVSAAERRLRAAEAVAKLTRAAAQGGKGSKGGKGAKPGGRAPLPIALTGRAITTTFWGKAWCDNLEAYADFAHRLARGRSYVRAGAVVDLHIEAGRIEARVSGSELYEIEIGIKAISAKHWKTLAGQCAGRIGSLVGLLRGELPDEVMRAVTDPTGGLFPDPAHLSLACSCPDIAEVCKHVAATLYGVGARLDTAPDLLFRLRGIDPQTLIEHATTTLTETPTTAATLTDTADLGALFGIDLASAPPAKSPRKKR